MNSTAEYDFPDHVVDDYHYIRCVPDVGWCGVHRLLFHWTVHCGITDTGYEDRWCFATEIQALNALTQWDGNGDMPGDWHKHPRTGRYRDPATGEIWDEGTKR